MRRAWLALLALVFITTPAQAKVDGTLFSQALEGATKEMFVAADHADAANKAFEIRDFAKGCPEAQQAYDHYTASAKIFEDALVVYEKQGPEAEQIRGWLREDIAAMKHHRLPYDLFLKNVCPAYTSEQKPAV